MDKNPKGRTDFLARLTEMIENNLANEQFGVNELAGEMGMSRSNLHRKVKSASGASVSKFICNVKLVKAKELLRESSSSISEIAFTTGFHSVTYFSKCFRDHFGYPPGEERKQDSEMIDLEDLLEKQAKKGIRKKISALYLYAAIFLLILLSAIFLIFKPSTEREETNDKAIAVLPFINDSPDESEMYFINGTMEAILNNLGKIKDLRVVSRNSVEQYRNNPKPTPVVAEEMKVSYVLEGSGHRDGDQVRLFVQLIDAEKDQHLWSKSYDANMEEIFSVQSDIARLVAGEIEAIITPEEMARIKKIPTTSQTAYDLYLRGMEEQPKIGSWSLGVNSALQKSEDLFRLALVYDSTFAEAYAQIASVYSEKYYREVVPSNRYLDSFSFYIEKALSYDDQLSEIYVERGFYYNLKGEQEKAINDFNKALELDPNNSEAFDGMAVVYQNLHDHLGAIKYFHKLELIDRGPILQKSISQLAISYFRIGCYDQSIAYSKRMLALNGDSVRYYNSLALCEYFIRNNTTEAINLLNRAFAIDPEDIFILGILAEIYLYLGNYEEALRIVEKKNNNLIATNQADHYQAFISGFIYQKNGDIEKANYYFDQQIAYCERLLDTNISMYGQLAFAYCGKGEIDKAFEYLRTFNQMERMRVYVLRNMQDDHYFENMQDIPEFQKIRQEVLAKYQAEHERVMNWLEENDRL